MMMIDILKAAAYLNAEPLFTSLGSAVFRLPCGDCVVYTDTEVAQMARQQEAFETIYPKG